MGPPVPFHPFFGWEDSPTRIDYRKNGTLILTSLLEDLVSHGPRLFEKKNEGRTGLLAQTWRSDEGYRSWQKKLGGIPDSQLPKANRPFDLLVSLV